MKQIVGSHFLREFAGTVLLSLCITPAMADEKGPAGLESEGVLMGIARISIRPGPGQSGFTFEPVANAKIYLSDDAQLQAGGVEASIVAFSQADGRFVLWDASLGGGNRSVMAVWASPDGSVQTEHMTATEVATRPPDSNSPLAADTLRQHKNVGWVTLLFAGPFPAPAPVAGR